METSTEIRSNETMTAAIKTADAYHNWVFSSFARFLQQGLALEVGSGHGKYSRRIAKKVNHLLVSDIDPVAVDEIKAELAGIDNIECMVMSGIEPDKIGNNIDNVVLVNILEHIEDDEDMLRKCASVMSSRGRLIIFVPAFQALFSRMDEDAGHFRRYRRRALAELVSRCGFKVVNTRYFNAVGFFGWYVNRLIGSEVNSGSTNFQVSLYNRLIPVLKYVDYLLPFLGQSLVLVAEKK